MIGVVADEAEHCVVAEFFELFKTPWEFHRPGAHYDVLICSNGLVPKNKARLLFLYGARRQAFEECRSLGTGSASRHDLLSFRGERMPIYGSCLLFNSLHNKVVVHERTKSAAAVSVVSDDQTVFRLGFDLFQEVRHLLTLGQPAEFAGIPTLDLHIALLRELILSEGLPLVEILPVPAGHSFIVCLTHDVDHPRVRRHKCDHTMFGFLYRALIGSVMDFCRGRRSLRQVALNWKAAFSLPLVFAGLAKDFWNQLDQYLALEEGLASSFFVIPTKGEAGVDSEGRAKRKRAARYSLTDIADDLQKLLAAKKEIAVHGVDAWRDSTKGRDERERIQHVAGASDGTGVRMHWLYFSAQTANLLEKAGFDYDSTIGYNETIGYRAGTSQVFRHPAVDHLLELPLHIMDTALFYPSYMNLSEQQASVATLPLIENAARFGGVLTINWHDRSLGPERLWGDFYATLLNNLRGRKPWFATAAQTVSWFRNRRQTSFDNVTLAGGNIRVQPANNRPTGDTANGQALVVRVYNRGGSTRELRDRSATFEDFIIDSGDSLLIAA